MSSSEVTPPEEMTRPALEEEVRERRQHQEALEEQLNRQGAALSRMINQINGYDPEEDDTDDGADPQEPDFIVHASRAAEGLGDTLDRVDDVENSVSNVKSKVKSRQDVSKETDNWLAVVEYAHDHADHPNNGLPGSWVVLYKDDIASATGLSARRGGQLIDEWAEDGHNAKDGTRYQPYKPPSAGNGNTAQKKALKIDLDVWDDPRGDSV